MVWWLPTCSQQRNSYRVRAFDRRALRSWNLRSICSVCSGASYIAVPVVQRLTIPASHAPVSSSLGLTFSYNVTIGIPIYIIIAKLFATY